MTGRASPRRIADRCSPAAPGWIRPASPGPASASPSAATLPKSMAGRSLSRRARTWAGCSRGSPCLQADPGGPFVERILTNRQACGTQPSLPEGTFTMKFKLLALATASLVALGATAGAQSGAKPAYGSWGYDATAMDASVKPGDDFWAYVNGSWDKRAQIAP